MAGYCCCRWPYDLCLLPRPRTRSISHPPFHQPLHVTPFHARRITSPKSPAWLRPVVFQLFRGSLITCVLPLLVVLIHNSGVGSPDYTNMALRHRDIDPLLGLDVPERRTQVDMPAPSPVTRFPPVSPTSPRYNFLTRCPFVRVYGNVPPAHLLMATLVSCPYSSMGTAVASVPKPTCISRNMAASTARRCSGVLLRDLLTPTSFFNR